MWYDSESDLLLIGDSGGVARTVPGVTGVAVAAAAAEARAVRTSAAPLASPPTLLGEAAAPAPAQRIDARAVRALWRGAAPGALRLAVVRSEDDGNRAAEWSRSGAWGSFTVRARGSALVALRLTLGARDVEPLTCDGARPGAWACVPLALGGGVAGAPSSECDFDALSAALGAAWPIACGDALWELDEVRCCCFLVCIFFLFLISSFSPSSFSPQAASSSTRIVTVLECAADSPVAALRQIVALAPSNEGGAAPTAEAEGRALRAARAAVTVTLEIDARADVKLLAGVHCELALAAERFGSTLVAPPLRAAEVLSAEVASAAPSATPPSASSPFARSAFTRLDAVPMVLAAIDFDLSRAPLATQLRSVLIGATLAAETGRRDAARESDAAAPDASPPLARLRAFYAATDAAKDVDQLFAKFTASGRGDATDLLDAVRRKYGEAAFAARERAQLLVSAERPAGSAPRAAAFCVQHAAEGWAATLSWPGDELPDLFVHLDNRGGGAGGEGGATRPCCLGLTPAAAALGGPPGRGGVTIAAGTRWRAECCIAVEGAEAAAAAADVAEVTELDLL